MQHKTDERRKAIDMKKFDAIIIGFGKGGKTLAGALAARGENVALVEKSDKMYGGTCPNVGCVPTKYMVVKSEISEIKGFSSFFEKAKYYTDVMAGKKALRAKILAKMFSMLDGNPHVTLYTAEASFVSPGTLKLTGKGVDETITSERIIIDTGSYPFIPPIDGIADSKNVYTSEGMLDLDTLPRRLVIIGGGNIGMEFASFYRNFGSEVTVLQDLPAFMPNEDDDIAAAVKDSLDAAGIKFEFGVSVTSVKDTEQGTKVFYTVNGEKRETLGNAVLVSTGRRPATASLNLAAAGVELTQRGMIAVDEHMRTSAPGVWAIGDVAGSPQFTYISLDDSRIVLSDMTGGDRTAKGRNVPYSIFVSPPLSRVGLTEKAAKAAGYSVKTVSMPVTGLPRSHVISKYTGLLKAAVDADTGMILGVSLFCEESHEMVNIVKLAMDCKLPYTALRDMIFTHPIMSEALNDLFAAVK